jgi:hypothetical protein
MRTDSRELEKLQDAIQQAFASVNGRHLVVGVQLTSGVTNRVGHGLARTLGGWTVVRKRGTADVWDDQDNCLNPDRHLLLKCSANVVVDIEVFPL